MRTLLVPSNHGGSHGGYNNPYQHHRDGSSSTYCDASYEKATRYGSSNIRQGQAGKAKGGSPNHGTPESGVAKGGGASKFSKNRDCLIHGVDCGHNSHQCKVLKAHATKVKAQFEAQPRKFVYKKSQNYKRPGGENQATTGTERKYTKSEVQQLMKNFSTKLNVENFNMEIEPETMAEEMEVDQALEELLNK